MRIYYCDFGRAIWEKHSICLYYVKCKPSEPKTVTYYILKNKFMETDKDLTPILMPQEGVKHYFHVGHATKIEFKPLPVSILVA